MAKHEILIPIRPCLGKPSVLVSLAQEVYHSGMHPLRILCLLLAICFSVSSRAAERPNIILILADDLGIYDLACYGRAEHNTPNLDQLAREGVRFTSAYCAQPICSPSRAALLTGKAPARLHLTTYLPGRNDAPSQKLLHPKMRQQLPLEESTLAERLKKAGYSTACVGKWHLGGTNFGPSQQGFDFVHTGQPNTKPSETEGGKGEQDLTARAIEFISANTNKPFFLYVPHNNPHIPYTAHPDRIAKNAKALEPIYAAVIEELDDSVGRLLAALRKLHLEENTIVIFTSDNGGLHVPEGGHKIVTHHGPFRAGKGFVYEGGLRIPLIIRWPGRIPAAKVEESPMINTDWTPTLCAIAGVESEASDGADISKWLLGQGAPPRRSFFWHYPHYTNQGSQPAGAMREGDWKLIEHYEDGRLELFNLAKDIGETNNLAAREPSRASAMRWQLQQWRSQMNAQTNAVNPDSRPEMHEALYVKLQPSLFNAARATEAEREEILAWRQRMNAALRR